MKFGVREITNVTMKAKSAIKLGNKVYYKDEPVLYFDSLKTSSLEGAATSVYATGGRGNSRLIAWEGERTLTFNMEDALLSPESFAVLSGAGLVEVAKIEDKWEKIKSVLGYFLHSELTDEQLATVTYSIDSSLYSEDEGEVLLLMSSVNTLGEITDLLYPGAAYRNTKIRADLSDDPVDYDERYPGLSEEQKTLLTSIVTTTSINAKIYDHRINKWVSEY